jgi:hypothetical protein
MGSAGRIGMDQHLWCVRVIRARAIVHWQRFQCLAQHRDVIGGGVTASVARPQQPSQGLPGGPGPLTAWARAARIRGSRTASMLLVEAGGGDDAEEPSMWRPCGPLPREVWATILQTEE